MKDKEMRQDREVCRRHEVNAAMSYTKIRSVKKKIHKWTEVKVVCSLMKNVASIVIIFIKLFVVLLNINMRTC